MNKQEEYLNLVKYRSANNPILGDLEKRAREVSDSLAAMASYFAFPPQTEIPHDEGKDEPLRENEPKEKVKVKYDGQPKEETERQRITRKVREVNLDGR